MDESERVYISEGLIRRQHLSDPLQDPQGYLDWARSSRWFQNRWPHLTGRPIWVMFHLDETAWSDLEALTIHLPEWAMNELTVLHELAHLCELNDTGHLYHGQDFRRAHLALVGRCMGRETELRYRAALRAFGL